MKSKIAFALTLISVLSIFGCSAQTLKEEQGYIATPDGVKLYYFKYGDGPEKVIIPGSLFLRDDFKNLVSDKRTIVFYDMRNRGQSEYVKDSTTLSIQQDVKDLETVRKHFNFQKTSLVGYSYLGLVVMLYAKDYSEYVTRIVQIGPVPLKFNTKYKAEYSHLDKKAVIDSTKYKDMLKLFNKGYHKSNPEEFCEIFWNATKNNLVGDQKNVALLRSTCYLSNEWTVNLQRHFKYNFTSTQNLDVPWAEFTNIDVPILTFHGTKDRNAKYGSGREWVFRMKNAKLITIDNAAHRLWLEQDIMLDINTFLFNKKWPDSAMVVNSDPTISN